MALQCMVKVSSWHITVQLQRSLLSGHATDCAARGVVCTTSSGRPAHAGLSALFTLRAYFHHHWSLMQSVQTVSIHTTLLFAGLAQCGIHWSFGQAPDLP